jgi:hypothetical protein
VRKTSLEIHLPNNKLITTLSTIIEKPNSQHKNNVKRQDKANAFFFEISTIGDEFDEIDLNEL